MSTTEIVVDIDQLRAWIGRSEATSDTATARLCLALRATLDLEPFNAVEGDEMPLAAHWCMAQPTVRMAALGKDGHPARGGFLPDVPLPRRMWAGGRLDIEDTIRVGDQVHRISRIADVTLKEGKSGRLCFVVVEHRISTQRGLAIKERQDIVYRDLDVRPARQNPSSASVEPRQPVWRKVVSASPVLLFRYSALTFNGHRIHYDRSYCTDDEGYPGLVVHGPLQATLLLNLAAETRQGRQPRSFEFRGVSPLFDGQDFSVNAAPDGDALELWTAGASGLETMKATATW